MGTSVQAQRVEQVHTRRGAGSKAESVTAIGAVTDPRSPVRCGLQVELSAAVTVTTTTPLQSCCSFSSHFDTFAWLIVPAKRLIYVNLAPRIDNPLEILHFCEH